MSKKLGPIFIDFNKTVAINIVRDGNNFNISITRNNNLAGNIGLNNYIRNLKRILKFEQAPDGKNLDIYLGKLKLGEITDYQMFGNLDVNTNYYNSIYLLTTTEVRMLSQGRLEDIEGIEIPFNRPPVDTNNHEAVNLPSPKTDLHTHMSGALTVDNMMQIGNKYNVFIEEKLLYLAGIITDGSNGKDYHAYTPVETPKGVRGLNWNDLSDLDKRKYADQLKINSNKQETFARMDECYDFRDPFVKIKGPYFSLDNHSAYLDTAKLNPNFDLFEDVLKTQLEMLCEHYQKTGVEYAELSVSDVCKNPKDSVKFLKTIDKIMPGIEEKYPDVTIRFLGGIPRCLTQANLANRTAILVASSQSKYVNGLDIMAHETNNTMYFRQALETCLRYAFDTDNPDYVLRVHAGESDVHNDNVKNFLQIAKNFRVQYCDETGKDISQVKMPVLRIGHGLHGLDDETIALCKELDAIIEINPSSNFSLNNVDGFENFPIKKYMDMGLHVVMGTDGHGMYSTDARQEAIHAYGMGVSIEQLEEMNKFERGYIERQINASKRKENSVYDEDEDLYTTELPASKDDLDEERGELLAEKVKTRENAISKLKNKNIKVDYYDKSETCKDLSDNDFESDLKGKTPICILGQTSKMWKGMTTDEKRSCMEQMVKSIKHINPSKQYIVTTGLELGFAGELLNLVHSLKPDVKVVSYIAESKLGSEYLTRHSTHVKIFKGTSFSFSSSMANEIKHKGGEYLVFGEGATTNDYIMDAHNRGCRMHLYNGAGGCNSKNKLLKGNGYEFVDYSQVDRRTKTTLTEEERQLLEQRLAESVNKQLDATAEEIDIQSDYN